MLALFGGVFAAVPGGESMHCGNSAHSSRTALLCAAFAASLAAATAFAPQAVAHDSPAHRVEELSARIAAEPDDAELYLERAEENRELGRWADAVADLQAVARLAPQMNAVHLATASLLLEAGDPDAAVAAVDRFLATDQSHVGAHLLRARALRRGGHDLAAAGEFSRAISLAGGIVAPDDYLDRAAALAAAGHTGDAIRGLDDGIAALGAPITLQLAAIDLAVARADYDGALGRIAAVEAKSSRRERWMLRRAEILELAGRRAEAAAACEDALAALAALPLRVRRLEATIDSERRVRAKLDDLRAAAALPSHRPTRERGGRS